MSNISDASGITTEVLENYRYKTDSLADSTVENIIASGFEKQINLVFKLLVKNNTISESSFDEFDAELKQILVTYFTTSAQLPSWADMNLIKQGEELFSEFGPEIFMLLNVSSLPMCYTCSKGAQVLYDTGRLLTHNGNIDPLARRLMETAQMIVNVMSPGGMAPNGSGLITIQKIRLIHASIRYFLKTKGFNGQAWDTESLGEPINQEDLAGTLMSFGPVILCGLEHLGVELNEDQQLAYMHTWKVVGHQMGIDEGLLPDSYQQGFDLATKILAHQAAESEAGKALTEACVSFINQIMPGTAFDDLPAYLMATFLSDFSKSSNIDLAACIGVEKDEEKRNKIAFAISKFAIGELTKLEHHKFIQKIAKPFNRLLLQGIIHHFNDGKSVNFFIPPSLQKNWKLEEEWEDSFSLISFGNSRIVYQKKSETI